MKREELKALLPDAPQDVIDKIMEINGADINAAKGDLQNVKSQLADANTELSELKKAVTGIEAERKQHESTVKELDGLKAANKLRDIREKVAKETGVPVSVLTGETEEACKAQAKTIVEYKKSSAYPHLMDGGEPGGAAKADARTQFAEWFNQVSK